MWINFPIGQWKKGGIAPHQIWMIRIGFPHYNNSFYFSCCQGGKGDIVCYTIDLSSDLWSNGHNIVLCRRNITFGFVNFGDFFLILLCRNSDKFQKFYSSGISNAWIYSYYFNIKGQYLYASANNEEVLQKSGYFFCLRRSVLL